MTKLTPSFFTSLALFLLGIGVVPLAEAPHVFTGLAADAGNRGVEPAGISNTEQPAGHAAFADSHNRAMLQGGGAAIDTNTLNENDNGLIAARNTEQLTESDISHNLDIPEKSKDSAVGSLAALGESNGDINNIGQTAGYIDFADAHNYTPEQDGGGVSDPHHSSSPGANSGSEGDEQDDRGDNQDRPSRHHSYPAPPFFAPSAIGFPDHIPDHIAAVPEGETEHEYKPESEYNPKRESGSGCEEGPCTLQAPADLIPVSYSIEEYATVPEPATYILILGGLGLLGFTSRSRKTLAS